jgi:dynein heavy chain
LEKALAALDSLTVEDFKAMAGFTSPSQKLVTCAQAVLNLIGGTDPRVPLKGKKLDNNLKIWPTMLTLLRDAKGLIQLLIDFKEKIDTGKVNPANFKNVQEQLDDPNMTVEALKNVSSAAAGLCAWAINIVIYYNVVVTVEPKKKAVAEGQATLDAANTKKAEVDALVAKLNAEVQVLIDAYDTAMKKKKDAEEKAAKCEMKLSLASRLLNALGAEKDRWAQSIIDLDADLQVIVGDVLLASAFVSYVGPFNKQFRDNIMVDNFLPFMA